MPTNKRRSGVEVVRSDRSGVRQHTLQPRQAGVGSSNEPIREDDETDWEQAFKFLSASLGKAWLGSDALVLIAYGLQGQITDEALLTYMTHVGLNRDEAVHNFMG